MRVTSEKRKSEQAQMRSISDQVQDAKRLRSVTPLYKGESNAHQRQAWPRKRAPDLDVSKDALTFQQIDIEYVTGKPLDGMPGAQVGTVPIVHMFGVTQEGYSVMAAIHGFTPYFYIPAPRGFTEEHCEGFRKRLNDAVAGRAQQRDFEPIPTHVLAVDLVYKQSIYGYFGDNKALFLQVFLALPRLVPTARGLISDNDFDWGAPFGRSRAGTIETFESNLDYVLRFMIDNEIVGGNWVTFEPSSYRLRPVANRTSSCQYEIDAAFDKVISHSTDGGLYSGLAPLRILSFDIECCGRKGVFPEPEHDAVIQIASLVTEQGSSFPIVKNVFVLDTCTPIVDAHVLSFDSEKEMLAAWRDFFVAVDPDVLIGYNTANFDIPYLMNRAETLGVQTFPFLGRKPRSKTVLKDATFSSKAYGTRENKVAHMAGRIQFDMLQVMQRDHKLSSYSLNSVSAHFLGEQKEDVHYSIIADLQNGTPEDRHRLAVYCLKDAYLPQRLLDKLMIMFNYIEMARVTGVPVGYLLERGQQIKVLSQMYRAANPKGYIIPTRKTTPSDDKYEGATVIEPKKGFYDTPIATLDFSSLYPSIMMAHNLCYCTLLDMKDVGKLPEADVTKTPLGYYFVKPHVKKGILPDILENLLSARKRAKADLKKATDPIQRGVLDGRQLALKISANSVYGFTGALVGKLPCLEISASVTSFGRQMIDQTKEHVETMYTVANGYQSDATVVYGDTDSVMIKFNVDTVAEAMKLGAEAAEKITATFVKPINLEFEKVYYPYLLMNKKRYAGLYWTKPDHYDKMDAKGIETVRRDNCGLVRTLISTCLDKILIDRDIDAAINYTKETIKDLLCNRIDLSLLVITKGLVKNAEDYDNKQGHVELAERMRKRDPGTAPNLGDRVAYVMIKGAKGSKGYERCEDPIYVLENNVPIDYEWYLTNQLSKPLERLFEGVMADAVTTLLKGDHTRTRKVATPAASSGLMKFAVKGQRCVGCSANIPKGQGALCTHCLPREREIFAQANDRLVAFEKTFGEVWTNCQRCQGSLHQEVLCAARDCTMFYRRRKIQKDLAEANSVVEQLRAMDVNDTAW